MNILAFNGSPRKGGNTEKLLAAVLAGAAARGATSEVIRLSALQFKPCQGCGGCDQTGQCVLADELSPIYDKILTAPRIIIASPIYFYGVTSQTKAFIDRMQAMWNRKRLLTEKGEWQQDPNRKGYFLSVAATKGELLFEGAMRTVRYAFDAIGMQYSGDLLVRKIDARGAIDKAVRELELARLLGEEIAS